MDWFSSLDVATLWRGLSVLMLGWLCFFFGRTLAPGQVPLIERIARVSDPDLKPPLQRYTRLLTALWSAWFAAAALLALWAIGRSPINVGAWVGPGSALLFVGEHGLRRLVFPGERFPGLVQQVRDTWTVWHPRNRVPE